MLHRLMNHLMKNKDTILAELDEKWVREYECIQKGLPETNVAECYEFRRRFKGFYFKGAGVNDRFQDSYFEILEREKGNPSVSFKSVLEELPKLPTGGLPKSYTSKLVATVNPNKPVYDSNVWKCLSKYGRGKKTKGTKFCLAVENYGRLVETTDALVKDPSFATLRSSFDDKFNRFAHFTDMKKLDLYLWSAGRGLKKSGRMVP